MSMYISLDQFLQSAFTTLLRAALDHMYLLNGRVLGVPAPPVPGRHREAYWYVALLIENVAG